MTRHVATPDGVEFYHKPIGTPLGHGKAGEAKRLVQAASSFAGSEGALSKLRGLDQQKLDDIRKPEGGFSLNARGEAPKAGFMVSLANGHGGDEKVLSGHASLADIAAHRKANEAKLLSDPTLYHGGWNEGDHDTLDLSQNHPNAAAAYIAAVRHNQRAVYDVVNGKAIDTDELGRMLRNKGRGKGTIHP